MFNWGNELGWWYWWGRGQALASAAPVGSGHGAEGLSSSQGRGVLGWEPPKPHDLPGEGLPALKWLSQCPADAISLEHGGSWRGEPSKAAPNWDCGWQAMLSSCPVSRWCSKRP